MIKHSIIYIAAKAFASSIAFISIAIYSRLINPVQYGTYSLVLVTVLFVKSFAFQWLKVSAARYGVSNKNEAADIMSNITAVYLMLTVLLALAGLLLYFTANNPDWKPYILFVTVILCLESWFDYSSELIRGRLRPVQYGLLFGTKSVISLGLGVLLVIMHQGVKGILYGVIAGNIAAIILVSRTYFRRLKIILTLNVMKKISRIGLPLALSSLLALIIDSSDKYIIQFLMGRSAVGNYSVAYDLTRSTVGFLMLASSLGSFPLAVKSFEERGGAAASAVVSKGASIFFLVTCPAVCGLAMLSYQAADILVGPEYREAAKIIIPWIAVASFISGVKMYFLDRAFILTEKTKALIIPTGIGALTNVALNFMMIPRFGLMGAIYATVISYTISAVLSYGLGRRYFNLSIDIKDTSKIILATLGMAVFLSLTSVYSGTGIFITQVIIGALIYAILIYLSNGLETKRKFQALLRG